MGGEPGSPGHEHLSRVSHVRQPLYQPYMAGHEREELRGLPCRRRGGTQGGHRRELSGERGTCTPGREFAHRSRRRGQHTDRGGCIARRCADRIQFMRPDRGRADKAGRYGGRFNRLCREQRRHGGLFYRPGDVLLLPADRRGGGPCPEGTPGGKCDADHQSDQDDCVPGDESGEQA